MDLASGVKYFTFNIIVIWREGRLSFFVKGGGSRIEVRGCAEDYGAEGEVIKHFAAIAPNVGAAIFSYTFIVEAIYSRDLPGLMVSTY